MLGQGYHQAILRKHIEQLGGHVEFGTSLLEIENEDSQEGARVRIAKDVNGDVQEEKASFNYIVGADGGRGRRQSKE